MKAETVVKCALCQSSHHQILSSYPQPDPYELAVGVGKEGYFRQWVQCQGCGLCYSVFSRDPDILDNIYKSAYRNENSPWRKGSTEEIFNKVINLPDDKSETVDRINWIKKNLNDVWEQKLSQKGNVPHKLLDIGGGSAVFAYKFQDDQWVSYIVDANASGDFINTKLKIPFIQDYYRPNIFGVKFNLISMVFVLEHLRDPKAVLLDIKQDMTEDSYIYIEVPDMLAFKLKPYEDDIFNSCHLWMFSPNTLTILLDQCGYEIHALQRMKTKRDHLAIMALATKI